MNEVEYFLNLFHRTAREQLSQDKGHIDWVKVFEVSTYWGLGHPQGQEGRSPIAYTFCLLLLSQWMYIETTEVRDSGARHLHKCLLSSESGAKTIADLL